MNASPNAAIHSYLAGILFSTTCSIIAKSEIRNSIAISSDTIVKIKEIQKLPRSEATNGLVNGIRYQMNEKIEIPIIPANSETITMWNFLLALIILVEYKTAITITITIVIASAKSPRYS